MDIGLGLTRKPTSEADSAPDTKKQREHEERIEQKAEELRKAMRKLDMQLSLRTAIPSQGHLSLHISALPQLWDKVKMAKKVFMEHAVALTTSERATLGPLRLIIWNEFLHTYKVIATEQQDLLALKAIHIHIRDLSTGAKGSVGNELTPEQLGLWRRKRSAEQVRVCKLVKCHSPEWARLELNCAAGTTARALLPHIMNLTTKAWNEQRERDQDAEM